MTRAPCLFGFVAALDTSLWGHPDEVCALVYIFYIKYAVEVENTAGEYAGYAVSVTTSFLTRNRFLSSLGLVCHRTLGLLWETQRVAWRYSHVGLVISTKGRRLGHVGAVFGSVEFGILVTHV